MRITSKHSHMNGEEYLLVHKPKLWQEICDAISSVDAEACKTKVLRKQAAPRKKDALFTDGHQSCGQS